MQVTEPEPGRVLVEEISSLVTTFNVEPRTLSRISHLHELGRRGRIGASSTRSLRAMHRICLDGQRLNAYARDQQPS
jgi:hypothetical protein